MTISPELRGFVRGRAHFACEYCSVAEIDSGGELTIDHYQPPRRGGSVDSPDNLLYCCHRCNQYKSDYWPVASTDVPLWNPQSEARELHMVFLADGTLYPTTATGVFTIHRLRLNRPALIAHRLRHQRMTEETRLLEELRRFLQLQERLQEQHAQLIQEQRGLLERQRELLTLLVRLLQ